MSIYLENEIRMVGILPGDSLHNRLEEHDRSGSSWYLSRKEIEENSPSRRDGIDLKKETFLRKSYCTFLQDLGMRLKVPQVTIATAIIFCHRFFLRQSHAKNDRRTIATACMFSAGKAEETPRPLKDVILVSYEIIHKKDHAAVQRIKQREIYEQQKELILLGERVVLATLGFDLNLHHPYKPLVEAIKKFKVAQNALAQVAWNFVNDGLRTSLCLQFKPHHIAAGAIFLAAKFLKVKLPSDGEKVWWQEFEVTARQLEVVSNQMLELYEQNRAMPPSHGSETEGTSAGGATHRASAKTLAAVEELPTQNGYSQSAETSVQQSVLTCSTGSQVPEQSHTERQSGTQRTQNLDNSLWDKEPGTGVLHHKMDSGGTKDHQHHEPGDVAEVSISRSNYGSECSKEELGMSDVGGTTEAKERKSGYSEGPKGYFPLDGIKKFDKDKVKAALKKRKKSQIDAPRVTDLIDEDDLIERELENGVELAAKDERIKQEKSSCSKPLSRNLEHAVGGTHGSEQGLENAEEGELLLDFQECHSVDAASRKRKAVSPGRQLAGKKVYDLPRFHVPCSKNRDSHAA